MNEFQPVFPLIIDFIHVSRIKTGFNPNLKKHHLKNCFTVVFASNFRIRPLTEYAFNLRPPQHFIGIFCLTKLSYNYEYSYITYENQSLMSYLKRLASPLFPPVTIFYNKHTVISTHTDFHTHTPPPSQSLYTLIRTLV